MEAAIPSSLWSNELAVNFADNTTLRTLTSLWPDRSTILFAGGGTGGHLFPGIALAERLLQLSPAIVSLFVGSDRPIEHRIMQSHGVEHRALPTCSLQLCKRRPDLFFWRNWRAVQEAHRIVQTTRPAVVVGLGGFASAPVVWAAYRAQVPIVLLEQNAIPGRATCWLSRFAKVVCTTFPESSDWLPAQTPTLVCGNPVRQSIADLWSTPRERPASATPHLLVLGGSLGADGLNSALMELVRHRPELRCWKILHQTGPRQMEAVRATYAELGQPAEVSDYFADMPALYQQADVVISRAGATTLSELACAGCPTILVPFPKATDDHQRANAESFVRHGAAVVVEQATTTPQTAERLWESLQPLLHSPERRHALSEGMRGIARPDAADRILSLLQPEPQLAACG